MTELVRIAMWSGPRNISTAMMRAFENRPDTAVLDEPFYAAYLAETGLPHPMREEVMGAQPTDWRAVVEGLLGPALEGKAVVYAKLMTHHILPGFGRDWMASCRNAFLIRDPVDVLASYAEKRTEPTLADIGLAEQVELFDRESDRLGTAPPVIESEDVLADPPGTLATLCAALGIPFMEAMLAWPPGRRATAGVWAPAWYDAVERSTGFGLPGRKRAFAELADELKPVAAAARPLYERLAAHRLS